MTARTFRNASLLIVTHALLVGGGYLWHRTSKSPGGLDSGSPARTLPARAQGRTSAEAESVSMPGGWSASDYRLAWRELARQKLPPAELAELRNRILEGWAEKDLHSALIAMSDRGRLNGNDLQRLSKSLIVARRHELLDWILAGDFGLDGKELLGFWTSCVAPADPSLLLASLDRIPGDCRDLLLSSWVDATLRSKDAGGIPGAAANIEKLPGEADRSEAWTALLGQLSWKKEDAFFDMLSRSKLTPEDRGKVLQGLVDSFWVWAGSEAESRKRFARLSPEDQSASGSLLLDTADKAAWASPTQVSASLSMLADSGQWDLLRQRGEESLDKMLKSDRINLEAASRWALTLPEGEATAPLFRKTVAARLAADPVAGAAWVESLPEGWHRTQAETELGALRSTSR